MSNNSTWPIGRTLLGATTMDQSGPGSKGNEEVLCIPQSSSFTGATPSDSFVSYPRHSLGESYTCAQMQSMYWQPQLIWAIDLPDQRHSYNMNERWGLWSNSYCCRKWTRQPEFKSWVSLFHIALIPLWKVWIQWFSLQLWIK